MSCSKFAINIIKRDDSGSPLLDEDKLKQLLINTQASDIPVAFYSICGTSRLGKSFLWNQFVRYLKDKHLFLSNLDSTEYLEKFFEWKGGDDRHTDGILVYKHPFILRTSNYRQIALFLMDTQGMFDSAEAGENSGMIFTLSFLISSMQVVNVQSKLESTDLQHSYKAMQILQSVRKCKPGTKPMQSLMYLVRDWKRKSTHPLGLDGGTKYVDSWMEVKDSQAADQQNVRQEIKNNFQNCFGFLLPEPGSKIVDMKPDETNSQIKDAGEEFYQSIEMLFCHICNEDNIVLKTVDGTILVGKNLYTYIVECAQKVAEFSGVKEAFGTFIKHDYRAVMRTMTSEVLSSYITDVCVEFQKHVKNKNGTYDRSGLHERHQDLKNAAIEKFKLIPKPGEEELHNRWRKVLEVLIEKNYNKFKDCVLSEEALNRASKNYEDVLRSSAKDFEDRTNRILHPKDTARNRSEEALEEAIAIIQDTVHDSFIAEQCCFQLKKRANILLDQHLLRIERIITGVAIGIGSLALGGAAGAVAAALEIPAIMTIAGATKLTTGLIVKTAVVGSVTSLTVGLGSFVLMNHLSPVEQMIRMSWAEGGDDLSCIEAEIGVALSYGVVRFRMENTP